MELILSEAFVELFNENPIIGFYTETVRYRGVDDSGEYKVVERNEIPNRFNHDLQLSEFSESWEFPMPPKIIPSYKVLNEKGFLDYWLSLSLTDWLREKIERAEEEATKEGGNPNLPYIGVFYADLTKVTQEAALNLSKNALTRKALTLAAILPIRALKETAHNIFKINIDTKSFDAKLLQPEGYDHLDHLMELSVYLENAYAKRLTKNMFLEKTSAELIRTSRKYTGFPGYNCGELNSSGLIKL